MKDREIMLKYAEGPLTKPAGSLAFITQNDQTQQLDILFSKNEPVYHINYSQITDADWVDERTTSAKNKSVLGRAAAGGLVLGPLGAIVGGMSGAGQKQINKVSRYLIICYQAKSGESSRISFVDESGLNLGMFSFVNMLKKKIAQERSEEDLNIEL